MDEFYFDFDPVEVERQLCCISAGRNSVFEIQVKEDKSIGDLLPSLSQAADMLPDYFLEVICPGVLHRMTVSLYMSLANAGNSVPAFLRRSASEACPTYVSTWEIMKNMDMIAENIVIKEIDKKHADDARYWTNESYREARISALLSREYFETPLFLEFEGLITAIQEIEGLMTYDISENGNMTDIVAPTQSAVMNLFEQRKD